MRNVRLSVVSACALALGTALAEAADGPAPAAAKLASAQSQVETRSGGQVEWRRSVVGEALRPLDHVRTGPASRAAILYSDSTLHRLNEKSEIEILAPTSGKAGLLKILSGQHHFTSRTPRDYDRVETATVTAAIRGTEFGVDVADDGTTTITMIEGIVAASNELGSVTVGAGEQAFVEPGKAPVRRIVVRPKDAVAWALYYPPVVGGSDAQRLKGAGQAGQDLAHAADLLAAGQVAQARSLVDGVLAATPEDPTALALFSVIATAAGDRDEAMRRAERARASDPSSPAAALALSFAAQARFDIPRARAEAERAAELDPQSSVALARAAELRMAEGDLEGARRAAAAAVSRAPNDARALTVQGFVELTRFRSEEAASLLERAAAADPGLPLARLGLGIAWFRLGDTGRALEELQTATALDPEDSIARSYLGKAYYELKRSVESGKELERAKLADPQDPTPHLYDAIRLQTENRPVEALAELRAAMERNDRRAVYRSRLLLDQDLAARGADLAHIYNDLGFEEVGLVAARRSADEDQANHSSHLFLSGSYRALPGYAPAFLSEVLQARIYQPVGVNATRPDVVSETGASFNEYTALFDRPRARFFGGGSWGRTNTDLGGLVPPGQLCLAPDGSIVPCIALLQLDDSTRWSGDVMGSYHGDRFAVAVGARRSSDDGFRTNSDDERTAYRGFFQWAPGWRDAIQLNVISGSRRAGDLPLRETPATLTPERFDTDETNVGVGWHRRVSAASDLAVSAIFNDTEQTGRRTDFGTRTTGRLHGPQVEFQQVLRRARVSWVFGAGGFDGTFRLEDSAGTRLELDDRFLNGYVYARIRRLGPVEITAGAAFEKVDSPSGLLPARDSFIAAAPVGFEDSRVSPKVGVSIHATPSTVIRLAGFGRLSPFLGRVQSLEPTQVAGFNQLFDEPGGTRSLTWGVGVDQDFGGRVFAGLSLARRDLTIPEAYCEFPDAFGGCAFQTPDRIVERSSDEGLATVYLSAAFGRRVTGRIAYDHEDREFDRTQMSPTGLFEDRVRTKRLTPEARVILPGGFFAVVRGTRYEQLVEQFDDLTSATRFPVRRTFWIGDLSLGYRLPDRWGTLSLDVRNFSDREYAFFLPDVQDDVIPAACATLRLTVTY